MTAPLPPDERALRRRASAWPEHPSWRGLTAGSLRAVADREGLDFATALLHERLVQSEEHGPFIRQVQSAVESGTAPGGPPGRLAIVPGACYAEFPETGADGRRLRECAEDWGWPVETIPVPSVGSLSANARVVGDWLADRRGEPVVLLSLSKGGADVKTALAGAATALGFGDVRLWISLSGMIHGTPLAGWYLDRWMRRLVIRGWFWYHGFDVSVLREVDRRECGALAPDLVMPEGLRVVHVVGVPLLHHVRSPRARRAYSRLAPLGPDDGGGLLLGDVGRLPGLIYPVWGADHYLEPEWDIRPLIRAIVHVALRDEARPCASAFAGASRALPDPARQVEVSPGGVS